MPFFEVYQSSSHMDLQVDFWVTHLLNRLLIFRAELTSRYIILPHVLFDLVGYVRWTWHNNETVCKIKAILFANWKSLWLAICLTTIIGFIGGGFKGEGWDIFKGKNNL